ncbi:MAG: hypothetical protein R3200_00720 [Xanthomonadales bacterium]|nr:hypothetical protein [Xanthomonadales bacterium]
MPEAARKFYRLLTDEDGEDICRDISDDACTQQPRNFLRHVLALSGTKTGDALMDPKLVLSWLLTTLGAPAHLTGWLVPIRESGALLPQLFIADRIRNMQRRKWAWTVGSLVQGLAVAGMAYCAVTLTGQAAGWGILGCLTVFALARSVCSVTYKDVLGKTIARNTRGTVTGSASAVAAGTALLFGAILSLPWIDVTASVVAIALAIGAGLWLTAAGLFATLAEPAARPSSEERGLGGIAHWLREDSQLRRFVTVRGLLLGTALAPPYLVALGGTARSAEMSTLGTLGPLVLASASAPLLSSYQWGRLADRSSRRVLIVAGGIATIVLGLAGAIGMAFPHMLERWWTLPLLLFGLMVSYQGVRLGRSTHLVDMTDAERRAGYTALSNTLIGFFLVLGGAFGWLADAYGPASVLAAFALLSALATWLGRGLDEVQS